jgi:Aspartyl protease
MRWLSLMALLLGVAALGVWAGAGGVSRTTPADRRVSAGDGTPPNDLGRALRDLGYASVPIDRTRPGYSVVAGVVRGQEVRLILDTGAPVTCLDRRRTEALNLDWAEEPVPGQARGSNWDPYTSAEVASLAIGEARAEGVRVYGFHASAFNHGLEAIGVRSVDGLLGADVLDAVGAVIDLPGGQLHVRPGLAAARRPDLRQPEAPGVSGEGGKPRAGKAAAEPVDAPDGGGSE